MTSLRGVKMKIIDDNQVGVANRRVNIRESKYDDLRQLEAAIREAYVAKELKAQIVEAEAARVAAQARERLKNEMLKRAREEAEKITAEKNLAVKSAKIKYGIELQSAINSRKKDRDLAKEIERRERRIIEEVSRVIEETQEARKINEKLELADRISRELRIFQEVKEIRLQKEAEILEAARKRDLNYLEEIEMRIEDVKRAKMEQKKARESVIEMVSKSLLESREKRVEINAIIADLVIEEKLFEEELKLREEKERRKLAREEAVADMERHRILIEERKLRHAIEEEEFAAAVMRKVLDDLRVERLTIEARKRKQIEYRKALDEIIEERRRIRFQEMIKLEESLRLERIRGEAFRKRVKEMREKLIIKHAGNVAEFISIEALSDEERAFIVRLVDNKFYDIENK